MLLVRPAASSYMIRNASQWARSAGSVPGDSALAGYAMRRFRSRPLLVRIRPLSSPIHPSSHHHRDLADPALSATFPSYHGLVTIHTLPAPHTVLPPSDKHSTLRGSGVSGENNIAFKCTRKRMLFETLHLDIEGGVGERRTTPRS